MGRRASPTLYTAATLRRADRPVDEPLAADRLAAPTGTHAPSLDRMLLLLSRRRRRR